jgi:hypothetical protein
MQDKDEIAHLEYVSKISEKLTKADPPLGGDNLEVVPDEPVAARQRRRCVAWNSKTTLPKYQKGRMEIRRHRKRSLLMLLLDLRTRHGASPLKKSE